MLTIVVCALTAPLLFSTTPSLIVVTRLVTTSLISSPIAVVVRSVLPPNSAVSLPTQLQEVVLTLHNNRTVALVLTTALPWITLDTTPSLPVVLSMERGLVQMLTTILIIVENVEEVVKQMKFVSKQLVAISIPWMIVERSRGLLFLLRVCLLKLVVLTPLRGSVPRIIPLIVLVVVLTMSLIALLSFHLLRIMVLVIFVVLGFANPIFTIAGIRDGFKFLE